MNELAEVDQTKEQPGRTRKYVWVIVVVLALIGLPSSRFQALIKMAVWTAIFLGVYLPYIAPYARDTLSKWVAVLLVLAHLALVCILFPHVPHDDYMFIGLSIIVEICVFSIPAGWLVLRAREKNRGL